MKEHKVGEIFKHGNVMLMVVEDPENSCDRCYFCAQRRGGLCGATESHCLKENRKDKISVKYIYAGDCVTK